MLFLSLALPGCVVAELVRSAIARSDCTYSIHTAVVLALPAPYLVDCNESKWGPATSGSSLIVGFLQSAILSLFEFAVTLTEVSFTWRNRDTYFTPRCPQFRDYDTPVPTYTILAPTHLLVLCHLSTPITSNTSFVMLSLIFHLI